MTSKNALDGLVESIQKYSNGRKLVFFGYNEETLLQLEKKGYKINGIFTSNTALLEKDPAKFTPYTQLDGHKDRYYVINPFIDKNGGKWQRLMLAKFGYTENEDYVFYSGIDIVLENKVVHKDDLSNYVECKSDKFVITINGTNNKVFIDENVQVHEKVRIVLKGDNNNIHISSGNIFGGKTNITLKGNSSLVLGKKNNFKPLDIFMFENGNLDLGEECSFADNLKIIVSPYTRLIIGNDCMFSFNIVIQTHDGHSIFDLNTGKCVNNTKSIYLDDGNYINVEIGDHVWVGMAAKVFGGREKTFIGSGSIVGANAFVKGKFPNNCAIGGLPARILKRNIAWSRRVHSDNIEDCSGYTELTEERVNYDIKKIPNRIFPKYSAHSGRDEFFRSLKTEKLSEAVNMVESNKHDIGLVGIYTVENFGGALTYFALYKTLQSMGHSVLMIERPNNSKHRPGVHRIYNVDPFPAFDKAKIYPNKPAMRELNNYCDTFVLGSDQLFHNTLYNNFAKWCTLDWVQDNKRKIAYAASFGHDKIFSSERTCAEMSYFMKKFDYFSVREKSGVELARDHFGVKAQWVLDPVFLCESEEYYKLAQNSTAPKKSNYISCYILDPNAEKANIIKETAAALNLDHEIFSEMKFNDIQRTNDFDLEINPDVFIENRLSSLINSDFVIADSFHGICFAIIFRKNFIAIPNSGRGKARFYSILELLGLTDRMVETAAQLREKSYMLSKPIDYDNVYKKLDYEKIKSRIWLENALNEPIDKGLSTYDVLVDYIKGQLAEREADLSRREAAIDRKIQQLISITGTTNKICSIDKLTEYFTALSEEKDRYLIAIAVKDTPGIPFSDEYYKAMSLIGVKTSLVNKHWHGYAALVNSGELIDEKCVLDQAVKICTECENLNIEISSSPLNAGNRASVIVNGSEFAVNGRGVNVVVYDKIGRYVCDSISFDTHIPNAPSSR